MARKPPKTRADGQWTEAKFWSWLRSELRRSSTRWPPISKGVYEANRRAYSGPNKRQKWEYMCAGCNHWFKRTEIHRDHIEPVGSLTAYAHIAGFIERLFIDTPGMQLLCEACHQQKTNKQREENIS